MAYLAGPGAKNQSKIDGFTPEQRVFLGWAQVWCENARPEAERLKAATNPHSSNKYRVNGPMSNMPEFQKAFSCKANAPMVRHERVPGLVTAGGMGQEARAGLEGRIARAGAWQSRAVRLRSSMHEDVCLAAAFVALPLASS